MNSGQELTLYKTGEPTLYEITAFKSGANPKLEAEALIDIMSDADFGAYLVETGLSYKKLPASCYSLENNELTYSSSETWKKVTVSIDPAKVAEFVNENTTDKYVIPITMTSANDSILEGHDLLLLKPTEVLIPSVSFGNTRNGVINSVLPLDGGTISIPLNMQVDNQWDFKANVSIVSSDLDGVTLDNNGVVNFVKGQNGTLNLNIPKLSRIKGDIKLKINGIEGMSGFNFAQDPITISVLKEKYPLTTAMLSSNAVEPSEGSLANLLDGNIATYFHSAWSVGVTGNHYVQVTLPDAVSKFVFEYTNRQANGNAALYNFNVYAGADENSLELVREYSGDKDTLPLGGAGSFTSEEIATGSPAKIIRFECTKNNTNGKFFVWSEFALHAM